MIKKPTSSARVKKLLKPKLTCDDKPVYRSSRTYFDKVMAKQKKMKKKRADKVKDKPCS